MISVTIISPVLHFISNSLLCTVIQEIPVRTWFKPVDCLHHFKEDKQGIGSDVCELYRYWFLV